MEKRITRTAGNSTLLDVRQTSTNSCSYLYVRCIFLLVLIFVVACGREVIVPESLTGEWRTSAPGYADRYIRFTINRLIYGTEDGGEISHMINKIKSEQIDHKTVYTFYYKDEEGDKTFLSFTYSSDAGGTIQLKNYKIDIIWKKVTP